MTAPERDPALVAATLLMCPACGAHGNIEDADDFVITERVIRSWRSATLTSIDEGYPASPSVFTSDYLAAIREEHPGARWSIELDASSDEVDWESSHDTKIECRKCFEEFPVPAEYFVEWV